MELPGYSKYNLKREDCIFDYFTTTFQHVLLEFLKVRVKRSLYFFSRRWIIQDRGKTEERPVQYFIVNDFGPMVSYDDDVNGTGINDNG